MSTVGEIKAAIESLSPRERAELESLLCQAPAKTPKPSIGRKQMVETVCGKYGEQTRPSEAFMHDKAEEKRLEERRWQS